MVRDNADDLGRHVFLFHVDRELMAQRILSIQVLLHKRLVDEHDVSHLSHFLIRVKTSELQRDLHRLKVIGVGNIHSGRQFPIGGQLLTVHVDIRATVKTRERWRIDRTC